MSKFTERIFFLKFVGILKFTKIREFQEFLKFTKFEFSIYESNNYPSTDLCYLLECLINCKIIITIVIIITNY